MKKAPEKTAIFSKAIRSITRTSCNFSLFNQYLGYVVATRYCISFWNIIQEEHWTCNRVPFLVAFLRVISFIRLNCCWSRSKPKATVSLLVLLLQQWEAQGVRLQSPHWYKKKWAGKFGLIIKLMSYDLSENLASR